jgi:hypothetical protein
MEQYEETAELGRHLDAAAEEITKMLEIITRSHEPSMYAGVTKDLIAAGVHLRRVSRALAGGAEIDE